MGITVGANTLILVREGSGKTGSAVAMGPDVCKVPSQPPLSIPIPYPNTAPPLEPSVKSALLSKALKKASPFSVSTGDEAGSNQGVIKRDELKQGLQVAGFSTAAAIAIVEGNTVERSADKMLLYSKLNRFSAPSVGSFGSV